MKCMKNEKLETYQEKKNFEKSQRKRFEVRERESVWGMNRCGQIERDRRNENQIAKNEYIGP